MRDVINHCEMVDKVQKEKLAPEDFQEEVMNRTGEIVKGRLTGKKSLPHKLSGVELVAKVIASAVMEQGADRVCKDLKIDLEALKKQAASKHISSC